VPPGEWVNAWSGQSVTGPQTVTNGSSLNQIPIYVRSGSVLALAPEMQYTGQKPWSPVTLDIYARSGETNQTTLYEDDTRTTGYERGEFRKTLISAVADATHESINVSIGKATGSFPGALTERAWMLRVRRPAGWAGEPQARVNGKSVHPLTKL